MPTSIFNPKTGRMETVPSASDMAGSVRDFFTPNRHLDDIQLPPEGPTASPAAPGPPMPSAHTQDIYLPPEKSPSAPPRDEWVRHGGISYKGPVDWASERAGFLSQPNPFAAEISARADAGQAQRQIEENAASDRPDLYEDMRNQYALQGLRQAAQQGDPEYRRQQAEEDAIQQAMTFLQPDVSRARQVRTNEAVGQQRQLGNLELEQQTDPRRRALDLIRFLQQLQLTQAQAAGRNPLAGILGGMGAGAAPGGAAAPARRADPMGIR